MTILFLGKAHILLPKILYTNSFEEITNNNLGPHGFCGKEVFFDDVQKNSLAASSKKAIYTMRSETVDPFECFIL